MKYFAKLYVEKRKAIKIQKRKRFTEYVEMEQDCGR
jgi:hypothetical protein